MFTLLIIGFTMLIVSAGTLGETIHAGFQVGYYWLLGVAILTTFALAMTMDGYVKKGKELGFSTIDSIKYVSPLFWAYFIPITLSVYLPLAFAKKVMEEVSTGIILYADLSSEVKTTIVVFTILLLVTRIFNNTIANNIKRIKDGN